MKPIIRSALLIAALHAVAGGVSKSGAQTTASDPIDQVALDAVRNRGFAGAAIGVAQNGRISFIRGYGFADIEQRVPVTDSTVFRIGSVTKQFTAAAILRLVDQGKLSVDDSLSKFLPNFPRANEVTLRQLMSHTSGIASYTHPKYAKYLRGLVRMEWPIDSIIGYITRLEPLYEFEPGTGWSYSNSGYMLLGAIIEKVTGKKYGDFLKSELLDPLELHDTDVDQFAPIVPHRARGYDPSKGAPSGFANSDYLPLSLAGPAGAMRSTVTDLLKWHVALFGGKVLKPATLAMMTAPGKLKDGRPSSQGKIPPLWTSPTSEYGFGLFLDALDGHKSVGHGGAINGFNTWMETYPDQQVTIVVVANTSYPAAEKVGPMVAKALFKSLAIP